MCFETEKRQEVAQPLLKDYSVIEPPIQLPKYRAESDVSLCHLCAGKLEHVRRPNELQ